MICDTCVDKNYCEPHRRHGEIIVMCGAYKKPLTNADRLRFMSDEELAKFIERSDCPPHDGICNKDNITCSRCWLDWLQSPAGEEQNGS